MASFESRTDVACGRTFVEVGEATSACRACVRRATGDNRERLFAKAAERYPSLAEMAHNTRRVIPLLVPTPTLRR
jgi:hypothetical protein